MNDHGLKNRLETRLTELMSEAKEIAEELSQPDSPDIEDRAVENEGDEVLEGLGNAAIHEIAEIRDAIQRMEIGTYGMCTSCGEKINADRLDALPHTPKCINCASGNS